MHIAVCCSKHAEFALWAADIRKVDIGLLPKLEEKELFKDFCEDFNTGVHLMLVLSMQRMGSSMVLQALVSGAGLV